MGKKIMHATIFRLSNNLLECGMDTHDYGGREISNWPDDEVSLTIERRIEEVRGHYRVDIGWKLKLTWTFWVDVDDDGEGRPVGRDGWSCKLECDHDKTHWADNQKLAELIASSEEPLDILKDLKNMFRKNVEYDDRTERQQITARQQAKLQRAKRALREVEQEIRDEQEEAGTMHRLVKR